MAWNIDRLIEGLIVRFPGTVPLRAKVIRENDGDFIPSFFITDVAHRSIDQYVAGQARSGFVDPEIPRLFGYLEEGYIGGDDEVRNLVHVGFLEALRGPPEPSWRIRELLGPRLRSVIECSWRSEIGVDQLIDELVARFPDTAPLRERVIRENDGELLPYVFIAGVANRSLAQYMDGQAHGGFVDPEIPGPFACLEEGYVVGDDKVRKLIHAGFLESLKGPPEPYWRVRELLGPRLRSVIESHWPSHK